MTVTRYPFRLGTRPVCPDCLIVYEDEIDDVCPHCGLAQRETKRWLATLNEIRDAGAACSLDPQGCPEILDWGQHTCGACGEVKGSDFWDDLDTSLVDGDPELEVLWTPFNEEVEPLLRACCERPPEACTCPVPVSSLTINEFFDGHDANVAYVSQDRPNEFCWSCAKYLTIACPPLRAWAKAFFVDDENLGPIGFFDGDGVGCPFYQPDEFLSRSQWRDEDETN